MEPCSACDWYRERVGKLTKANNPRAMYWEDKLAEHLSWHAFRITSA
jgi:hypothetical protein